jgi:hypothetical protein
MQRTFSPSEAAMSIFVLAKRQPQFVLRFCIIYAAVTMVTFALIGALGVGKAFQDYLGLIADGSKPQQDEILAIITPITSGLTILLIFGAITGAIVSAMGLRKVVLDSDEGSFGLKLGGDEGRLIIGFVIIWAILMGINIAISILGAVITFGNMGLMGLTVAASLLAMSYVGLRLSQFGVLTIADKKLGITASWRETRGQASRLLGAYLLWMIVALVITGIVQALGSIGASLLGAKVGGSMPASLAEFTSVGWLFYTLVYGLSSGFANLGTICIGAYAWHQMRGDLPATPQPS